VFAALAILSAFATPGPAAAELTVVVRMAGPADQALLARVRGSASDLRVRFIPVEAGALEAQVGAQLEKAATLIQREKADAAIWFQPMTCGGQPSPATGVVIHVSQPASGNVLVRPILGPPCLAPPEAPPSSALLESAALAVRTVLVALSAGGRIGLEAPARSRSLILRAGFIAIVDGLTPRGQQGLAGAVGLASEHWGVELAASSTLATPVGEGATKLWLSRAGLTAGVMARLPLTGELTGAAAAHAGGALIFRSTTALAPMVMPEPDRRRLVALFAGELRLGWSPPALRGVALVLGLGVDYLPGLPPVESERRQWRVEPRLLLGLELRP
jgi:hypothetical protein